MRIKPRSSSASGSPWFTGRDRKQLSLTREEQPDLAGLGRLVLIEGEAGVGKSTLIEQLEERLPDVRWCWGACDGLSTPRPLAPLHDIAEALCGELLDDCRAGAPRDVLFSGVRDVLRTSDGLTAMVFEDIHCADEATLDLLRHLGNRLRDLRALLLVSYRDEAVGASDPRRIAIGELARQRSTRRVSVPPLSLAAVEAIVAGTAMNATDIHRLTGGNPFFVTELMKRRGEELPASARDSVRATVALISAPAHDLVEAAALAGTESTRTPWSASSTPRDRRTTSWSTAACWSARVARCASDTRSPGSPSQMRCRHTGERSSIAVLSRCFSTTAAMTALSSPTMPRAPATAPLCWSMPRRPPASPQA
jgi:AAA ATPase domain